jgi:hypothetical protein
MSAPSDQAGNPKPGDPDGCATAVKVFGILVLLLFGTCVMIAR